MSMQQEQNSIKMAQIGLIIILSGYFKENLTSSRFYWILNFSEELSFKRIRRPNTTLDLFCFV